VHLNLAHAASSVLTGWTFSPATVTTSRRQGDGPSRLRSGHEQAQPTRATRGGNASLIKSLPAKMAERRYARHLILLLINQLQTTRLDPTDKDVGDLEVVVIEHNHVFVTENGT